MGIYAFTGLTFVATVGWRSRKNLFWKDMKVKNIEVKGYSHVQLTMQMFHGKNLCMLTGYKCETCGRSYKHKCYLNKHCCRPAVETYQSSGATKVLRRKKSMNQYGFINLNVINVTFAENHSHVRCLNKTCSLVSRLKYSGNTKGMVFHQDTAVKILIQIHYCINENK